MKKALLILIFILTLFVGKAESMPPDSAYNKEDYKSALNIYNELLEENGPNSDLYYNIGNTWYRMGNISQAILAYERALKIDPSNNDAAANLAFVRKQLQDKPEDNSSLLTRTHNRVVESMTANSWAWTAFVVFLILIGFAAVYIFSTNIVLRKTGFFGGIILLMVTVYMIVVAHDAYKRMNDNSFAIVTVPNTMLNSVPRQPKQTEKVVPLHEGTKVEIIDSINTPDDPVSPMWYNVKLNGSSAAWLRATDVTRI